MVVVVVVGGGGWWWWVGGGGEWWWVLSEGPRDDAKDGPRDDAKDGPREGPSEAPYAWALGEHSPAGHIQTEPQAQRSTRLWTWHEKASSWLPKTCECIGFCFI